MHFACGGNSSPSSPASSSPAATNTPTFTPTFTFTQACFLGASPSCTPTFTSTSTNTFTITYTPTITWTFTLTKTPTYTNTRTPTAAQSVTCLIASQAGNTSVGTSFLSGAGNLLASQIAMPSYGGLQSLAVHLQTATGSVRVAVYSDSSGPSGLIVQSATQTAVNGWNTIAIPPTYIYSGTYWLVCQVQNSTQVAYIAGGSTNTAAQAWGAFPGSYPGGGSLATATLSIYVNYCSEPSPTPTPSWQLVGGGAATSGSGQLPVLRVSGGTPYLAFGDCSNACRASVVEYTSGAWTSLGDISSGYAEAIGFNIYSGTPYIAYVDGANNYQAYVQSYSGGWSLVGSGAAVPVSVYYSLSLDVSTGAPYLAWINYATGEPTLQEYTAGSWTAIGASPFMAVSISALSLAMNGTTPYVACSYVTTGSVYVDQLMEYSGSSWVALGAAVTVTNPLNTDNQALTVVSGTPYLNTGDNILKYTAGSWATVGGSFGTGMGDNCWSSLYNDGGTYYLSFTTGGCCNSYCPGNIEMEKSTGSSWSVIGSSSISSSPVTWGTNSLAVYSGTPYIAYSNNSSGKIWVSEYH